eukprot:116736_1
MSQRRSLRLQASKPVDYTAERITLDCTTSVTRPTTTRNKNKKSKSTATTTRIDPKQLSTNTVPVVSYNDISVASVAQVQPDYGANSHKTDVHNTDVIEDDDVFKYGSEVISKNKGFKINPEIKVNEGDVGKYNDCASVPGASAVYDVRLNGRGQYYKGIVYEKGKDFVFDLDLDYFKKYVFDLDSDDFSNYKCQSRNKPWRNSKTDSVAGKLLDKLYQEPKMPKHCDCRRGCCDCEYGTGGCCGRRCCDCEYGTRGCCGCDSS